MRRLLLIALFALTLVSSGCGGADGSLLATAVRATEDAGGAEVAFQLEMAVNGAAPVVMSGSGVEDAKNRLASLTFAGPPPIGPLEMVQDDFVTYMRSEAFSGQFGKAWIKMDLEELGSDQGFDMSQVPVQTASDQLRMLEEASDGVTKLGTETVAGAETTHYSATVDVSRLPDGERLAEIAGTSDMPVDVWIDGDDRIRRVQVEQKINAAGVQMEIDVVVEYVRFGVPVDIEVPDDDEVIDVTDLVSSAS